MKKYIAILFFAILVLLFTRCSENKLEEIYPDPGKTSTASVERLFSGVMTSSLDYVRMSYWRLFVVEQPTMGHYTQVMGWTNAPDQYSLPAGPLSDRWANFYDGVLLQYRVFMTHFNKLSAEEKPNYEIFRMIATLYFYDHSQQMVDIWGKIPWSEAGRLRENSGDLVVSLPKYDDGEDIYTAMLDDLKDIADDFNTISIPSGYLGILQTQDPFLSGDVENWQRYCNSLRLRMLMRVSGVSSFQSRVQAEVDEIINNPNDYPLIESNDDNVIMKSIESTYESDGLRSAFETWGIYDLAPYAMIETMKADSDLRLECIFDVGDSANGVFLGIDPMLNASEQDQLIIDEKVARYNNATFTRSMMYPGWLCTAGEILLHKAEACSKILSNDAQAKEAYEAGIKASIEFYYWINQQSQDERTKLVTPDEAAIDTFLTSPGVSWDSNTNKNKIIAYQKWIHTGISQMGHTWAEIRRMNQPMLNFMVDNSSDQTMPPVKWVYPDNEKQLNGINYDVVKGYDDPNQKIFWDVN